MDTCQPDIPTCPGPQMPPLSHYRGVKEINATPMDYMTYLRDVKGINNSDYKNAEGYFVVYPDGYQSWSPKHVFEEAYKPYNNFLERLAVEKDELQDKLSKLSNFLYTEDYRRLATDCQTELRIQERAMMVYLDALTRREVLASNVCSNESL